MFKPDNGMRPGSLEMLGQLEQMDREAQDVRINEFQAKVSAAEFMGRLRAAGAPQKRIRMAADEHHRRAKVKRKNRKANKAARAARRTHRRAMA